MREMEENGAKGSICYSTYFDTIKISSKKHCTRFSRQGVSLCTYPLSRSFFFVFFCTIPKFQKWTNYSSNLYYLVYSFVFFFAFSREKAMQEESGDPLIDRQFWLVLNPEIPESTDIMGSHGPDFILADCYLFYSSVAFFAFSRKKESER
jgi:hypothetical protein